MHVTITVSPGEYLDRFTVLELKAARCDPKFAKAAAAQAERFRGHWPFSPEEEAKLAPLVERLRQLNADLWDLEDEIRLLMQDDRDLTRVAAAIARTNDERAAVKREIDALFGAESERKFYGASS